MTRKNKSHKWTPVILTLVATILPFCSCSNDDDASHYGPTALVTVRPSTDKSFFMQLNDSITLHPTNIASSPFGNKEVRALVNYTELKQESDSHDVFVNWIDSIRTKLPVEDKGTDNDKHYGNDAIEIVKDWVTIAEDGYLTMRIRTRWGNAGIKHSINLLTGCNPDNPYEMELRHNAYGDTSGNLGDALIAFNLNDLPHKPNSKVCIKLNWNSFYGKKTTEFNLQTRPVSTMLNAEDIIFNKRIK